MKRIALLLFLLPSPAHADNLLEKAAAIVQDCGSTIISHIRHTLVRGRGIRSCHWNGEAVDIKGNPSCIYRHLRDWAGGYSTDYSSVSHVHVSSCAREYGLHFRHGGHRHHRHHKHRG